MRRKKRQGYYLGWAELVVNATGSTPGWGTGEVGETSGDGEIGQTDDFNTFSLAVCFCLWPRERGWDEAGEEEEAPSR